MQNSIIRLPDEEAMHCHYFCSKCHFWLINEQLTGANFCPNCGQKLNWNETPVKGNIFKEFIKMSEERYSNLKETMNTIPNKENDMYLVIGTEDGYFDNVDMKKYKEAKERLEGGYYEE